MDRDREDAGTGQEAPGPLVPVCGPLVPVVGARCSRGRASQARGRLKAHSTRAAPSPLTNQGAASPWQPPSRKVCVCAIRGVATRSCPPSLLPRRQTAAPPCPPQGRSHHAPSHRHPIIGARAQGPAAAPGGLPARWGLAGEGRLLQEGRERKRRSHLAACGRAAPISTARLWATLGACCPKVDRRRLLRG